MPMKMMSGFDSETASAPTDELWICPSVTGAHVLTTVGRLPDPAAGRAEIAFFRAALHAGNRERAAAAKGPDASPGEAFENFSAIDDDG